MRYFIVILFLSFNNSNYAQSYKLIKKPDRILACGHLAWEGEFLFLTQKDSTQFIGVIKCPDFFGKDFFKQDSLYTIEFSKNTILPSGYVLLNSIPNVNGKLQTVLIDNIEIIKK